MPGLKDFVNLTVLAESDLDDYLAKQVVMKFASVAARDAAVAAVLREGMVAYLDDVNWLTVYDGTVWVTIYMPWTTFTPVVAGTGWALGNGIVSGGYAKTGFTYHFFLSVTFGSTSTFGAAASVTIAGFPTDFQNQLAPHGFSVTFQDQSLTTFSLGHCERTSASLLTIRAANDSTQWVATSSTVPFTWAQNDQIIITGTYQGAS